MKRDRGKLVMLFFALAIGLAALIGFELSKGLLFGGLFWSVSFFLAGDLTDRPWFLAGSMSSVLVSGAAAPYAFPELWRVIALEVMIGLLALTFALGLYVGTRSSPSNSNAG